MFLAGLTSLTKCREQLACNSFDSTVEPSLCLHHLLPPPRDFVLLSCLRDHSKFLRILNGTKKYQPFISHIVDLKQQNRLKVGTNKPNLKVKMQSVSDDDVRKRLLEKPRSKLAVKAVFRLGRCYIFCALGKYQTS